MLKGKKLGRGLAAVVAALCLAVPLGSAVHADEQNPSLVQVSPPPAEPGTEPTAPATPAPEDTPPAGEPAPTDPATSPIEVVVPILPTPDAPPAENPQPSVPEAPGPSVPAGEARETVVVDGSAQDPVPPLTGGSAATLASEAAPVGAEASPTPSPSATATSTAAVPAALPEPVTNAIDSVVATASGSPLYVQMLTIAALLAAGYLYFRALGSKGRRSPGNPVK